MKNSPKKLEEIPKVKSILSWINEKSIKNEKGEPLDYSTRPFLLAILVDWSQEIVVKACAQVGKSITFNIKTFYAVGELFWNVIYTMPTDGDVEEFVKSKTNPIIRENPDVFGGMSADSIYLKQIGKRFCFFKGTMSESAAISTQADVLIHDEADRSDQKTIHTYRSRIKNSKVRARWLFSNPTTEKGPIDEAWKKSDQKEWMVKCPKCAVEQQLIWPSSVDIVNKRYICSMCGAHMPDSARLGGRWVAQGAGKVSGYHLSHLMCIDIPIEEIIEDAEGDQEYFFNFVLGEPYNPGDLSVSKSMIVDCWTPQDMWKGPYFLGVDVGNIKHYVLGTATTILKMGRFSKWADLDKMLEFYKPQCFVIDAMPDTTASRSYVENHNNALMSFFGENDTNPMMAVWWGEKDKKGIVYSNRNRILDQLITDIVEAKYLFACDSGADFHLYLKHWETMRRVKTVNNKGIERYEWVSTTGEDHYCFATLYWHLATLGAGNGVFISETRNGGNDPVLIGNNNVVQDIARVMAANNNWDDSAQE